MRKHPLLLILTLSILWTGCAIEEDLDNENAENENAEATPDDRQAEKGVAELKLLPSLSCSTPQRNWRSTSRSRSGQAATNSRVTGAASTKWIRISPTAQSRGRSRTSRSLTLTWSGPSSANGSIPWLGIAHSRAAGCGARPCLRSWEVASAMTARTSVGTLELSVDATADMAC